MSNGVAVNARMVGDTGGRNGAYGPSYAQLDTRFGYRVNIGHARTVDLFAEVFNITNRSNFSNPSGDRRIHMCDHHGGVVLDRKTGSLSDLARRFQEVGLDLVQGRGRRFGSKGSEREVELS